MSDNPVDLSLIARQQLQLLTEIRTLRDDLGVVAANLQRLVDGTVTGLVDEAGVTNGLYSRLAARVRALETPAQ